MIIKENEEGDSLKRRGLPNPFAVLTLLTIILCMLGPSRSAWAQFPNPLEGTKADFYVSWKDGSDSNPGTKDKPFKTPGKAVGMLKSMGDPSGKVILIRGGTYRHRDNPENRLFLKDLSGKPGAPIEIRGYPSEKVVLDAFTQDFDPLTMNSVPCGWGGISLNHCSHIHLENFTVQGRCQCNVEVMDSNHITVRFIDAWRSNKHGLFTGGSFHHLTVEACRFYDHMYGSTASHGLYVSGGHWDPNLPPVRNVVIRYVECFHNGRHGIQFNGRIENVLVENCNLHHNVLGGLSLIGVRKAVVQENLMHKNNKQGIILYTYFDTSYWDPNDPDSVKHWLATHWAIQEVLIKNNTIFMDDIPWYDDEWINYNPQWHAGILITDSSGLLPPFKNIYIERNLIYNHSKMMINIENAEHFPGVYGVSNYFFSEFQPEAVACLVYLPLGDLQKNFPANWSKNLWGWDPHFEKLTPTLFIDGSYINIDFSDPAYNKFKDDYHLQDDSLAWLVGAGAFLTLANSGGGVADLSGNTCTF